MRFQVTRMAAVLAFALGVGACAGGPPPKPPAQDPLFPFVQGGKKVDFAISETKAMIQRSRGADYLPDLYMRLAELYTERARYAWLIAYERQKARGNDSRAVESPEARLLKNLSIGTYERVLREFPGYKRADEAMFLMAHEHRELGDFDQMRATYEKLIEQFPQSQRRLEAYLVLGDNAFDRNLLDEAERYYQRVLAAPSGPVHPLASYKLGWVRINRGDCKGAVRLFEDILKDPKAGRKTTALLTTQKSLDLTREALVDLAYCYPEASNDPAVPYFQRLAHASADYVAAMKRLGGRFFIKQQYGQAVNAWRELARLSPPNDDAVETLRKLYDGVVRGEVFDDPAADLAQIARVYEARRHDHRVPEAKRKKLEEELEVYARDIATRAHVAARKKENKPALGKVADAYAVYVAHWKNAAKTLEIEENRAEALLAAGRALEAGKAYEKLASRAKAPTLQAKARTNGVAAYQQAIDTGNLPRIQRIAAWTGLRVLGQALIADKQKTEDIVAVKLGVARSHYELGEYDRAAELFYALARQYPDSKEATVSGHLALDALRLGGDLQGLATLGRRMIADKRLGDETFRGEIQAIIAKAEQGQIQELTVTGDSDRKEALLAVAKRHKGSTLGEQALYNTLLVARAEGDIGRFYELGEEFLAQYPKSQRRPDVLAALAGVATDIGDYEKAARYLAGSYAANPAGKEAMESLYSAASMHAVLGEAAVADEVRKLAEAGRGDLEPLLMLVARSGNLSSVEQILAEAPVKGTVARFLRGFMAYSRGDLDVAARALENVAREQPENDEAAEAIARARFLLGEIAYESFVRTPANGPVAEVLAEKTKRLATAEKAYGLAIESRDARWALAAYARIAASYGELASFFRDLSLPAELSNEERAQLKQILGAKAEEAEGRAGELRGACAKKARELVAFGEGARACLGGSAMPEKVTMFPRLDGARGAGASPQAAEIRRALLKDPKNAPSLLKLAELQLGAGNPALALLLLERVEKLAPRSSELYNLRGVAYVRLGEPGEAFGEFKKAIALDGANQRARLNLAAHYAAYGHTDKARDELKAAGARPTVLGQPGEHPDLGLLTELVAAKGGGR